MSENGIPPLNGPEIEAEPESEPILSVTDLKTVFNTRQGQVHAVNGVSFDLYKGELVGVVGESGSGKSVTMMSVVKLLPSPPAELVSGDIRFEGRRVTEMSDDELRQLRGGDIGFVFQDPMTSLNPVFTIAYQLIESLRAHSAMSKKQARAKAVELLGLVGIPSPQDRLNDYPHQFSGGMRQRVMIAMALACEPKILIADEPTTALDVTIQAQILELVRELRQKHGMGIVWITHDLGVVAGIADRVIVMYGGLIVEHAPVIEIFKNPAHPYTRALLETLPSPTGNKDTRLKSIEGQPPNLSSHPSSCPFAPRCDYAVQRCHQENPAIRTIDTGHDVACWLDRSEQITVSAAS